MEEFKKVCHNIFMAISLVGTLLSTFYAAKLDEVAFVVMAIFTAFLFISGITDILLKKG